MLEFSNGTFKALLSHESEGSLCVSIYMPTERISLDREQAINRMHHLLNQAEIHLLDLHLSRRNVLALLAPARGLLQDEDFWSRPREGIALFLAQGFFQHIDDTSSATEFPEMLTIANHFQIKPLLPLLTDNGQFYILVLDQTGVKLFEATRDTINEVALSTAPTDIYDALGEVISKTETQGRPSDVGDRHEKFGAYNPSAVQKDRILRYFRVVDGVVHPAIAQSNAPLVLAGMEYQHSIYREANTYPHLLAQGVSHYVEATTTNDLHRLVWQIVEPTFAKARREALTRFQQNTAHAPVSTESMRDLLEAAHTSRIETLFIAQDNRRYGTFDATTQQLEEITDPQPGTGDVVDEAAAQTILNGGTVYVLPPDGLANLDKMPVAIMRY